MIPIPSLSQIKAAAVFVFVLLACLTTHKCTADHYKLKMERKDRIAAEQLAKAEAKAREVERQWQAAAEQMANEGYKALQEKERENARLRDAVESGRQRLRVAAKCPSVPQSPDSAGVDNGGAAELDASARPAYYALRAGIAKQHEQLKACQGIVRLHHK